MNIQFRFKSYVDIKLTLFCLVFSSDISTSTTTSVNGGNAELPVECSGDVIAKTLDLLTQILLYLTNKR